MIKLVATDMDGTFLDEAGQFDMERLKKLLHSYKEKGIYFAVASGRGLLSLEKHFSDVKDEIIFICWKWESGYVFMDKILIWSDHA